MTNFKKGDRVRVTFDGLIVGCGQKWNSVYGTIEEKMDYDDTYSLNNLSIEYPNDWVCFEGRHLELVDAYAEFKNENEYSICISYATPNAVDGLMDVAKGLVSIMEKNKSSDNMAMTIGKTEISVYKEED